MRYLKPIHFFIWIWGTDWDRRVFIWLLSHLLRKHCLLPPQSCYYFVWNTFPQSPHMDHSLILFRSLCKCHALKQDFPNYPLENNMPSSPVILDPLSSVYFSLQHFSALLSLFLVNSLTLQCKLHESQNFMYSTLNPQHIEQCLANMRYTELKTAEWKQFLKNKHYKRKGLFTIIF